MLSASNLQGKLSTLARGSEARIYSHKVCMYVRGGSRSGMSCGMSLHTGIPYVGTRYGPYVHHTVWHIQIRSTQILFGVLWWWKSGMGGHRGLDTTTPNNFYSKFENVTRATHASPAPARCIYDARTQSAHAYS